MSELSEPRKMNQKRAYIGRGSSNVQPGRFEEFTLDSEFRDEQWELKKTKTEYFDDDSRSIISKNNSPDLQFNFSLNPYRGCSHGCSYCYARPTHEYLGFGPGLDFESKIIVKRNASQLFRNWLVRRSSSEIEPIMLSGVTDCYQPCEKQFRITRRCLELALEFRHPIQVITKNSLILRDIDILSELARLNLANVAISVTSLKHSLTKILEPRTSSPQARLRTIAQLADAGVPTTVSVSPVIPGINDDEIPAILETVSQNGANFAFYVILRLPVTVKDVFLEWLDQNFPDRKGKVLSRVESLRDGKLNSSVFGERMRGTGIWADQINGIFKTFARKFKLTGQPPPLRTDLFRVVNENGKHQKRLF